MAEDEKNTINIVYKKSPQYAVYAVSGVYGGLGAHGDIVLNLFYERGPIPRVETVPVDEKGQMISKPISQEKIDGIVRDVMFSIVLNPNTAKSIAKWLLDKVELREKLVALAEAQGAQDAPQ
eukprot:TRINITY_DN5531_c1_g1_i1.p3 TRINITY_DN5531_c1_g1~~TRINITY_DN5531_c1_g1_i1.p3  ORF type:complete len:122 (-),score=8.58 TRINITY_DN5531_c1_g1_i1:886-1251(-)